MFGLQSHCVLQYRINYILKNQFSLSYRNMKKKFSWVIQKLVFKNILSFQILIAIIKSYLFLNINVNNKNNSFTVKTIDCKDTIICFIVLRLLVFFFCLKEMSISLPRSSFWYKLKPPPPKKKLNNLSKQHKCFQHKIFKFKWNDSTCITFP